MGREITEITPKNPESAGQARHFLNGCRKGPIPSNIVSFRNLFPDTSREGLPLPLKPEIRV